MKKVFAVFLSVCFLLCGCAGGEEEMATQNRTLAAVSISMPACGYRSSPGKAAWITHSGPNTLWELSIAA